MKSPTTPKSFEDKVKDYWTPDQIKKTLHDKKLAITPLQAPNLLRQLGILNSDASMSHDSLRKFIQINHLWQQFEPFLKDLASRHPIIRILDAGCGSAFLTFLLEWGIRNTLNAQAMILGIDTSKKLIDKCTQIATTLETTKSTSFYTSPIDSFDWDATIEQHAKAAQVELSTDPKKRRPHVVMSLHACDTASDDAIAFGVMHEADWIAVAPCCQAELAKQWAKASDEKTEHPLKPAFNNPHLRRELASTMTDLMRVLILRSHGYEVTTSEFTYSHATPKNTLITAVRRGRFHDESRKQYDALIEATGGMEISLAHKLRQ
jgi:hypothetical protein